MTIGINEDQPFWGTVEWKSMLMAKLMLLLSSACQMTSKIRPVTVDLGINLLIKIAVPNPPAAHELDDKSLALLEQAKEESIMVARTFFKVVFLKKGNNEIFVVTSSSFIHFSRKTCFWNCLKQK